MKFRDSYRTPDIGTSTKEELRQLLDAVWENRFFLDKRDLQRLARMSKKGFYSEIW